jgi:hypothetical protein
VVATGLGLIMLGAGGQAAWRAQRAVRRRAGELTAYGLEEADQMAVLADRLNRDGFVLQRTLTELAPRLEALAIFLQRPMVAASLPWLLRRMLGRPLKRRG